MADIFGFDLAYIALFITMIGVGASVIFSSWANKRATVKDVKEHTTLLVDNLSAKVDARLNVIEYKITEQEKSLAELKKINKDEILLTKQELLVLKNEIIELQKTGGTAVGIRVDIIEKRIDKLEVKLETLLERAKTMDAAK